MLKIKSNTIEFTIIFFWEDWKENKCWKILCSSPLFLSASALHLLVFSVSALFVLFSVSALFLSFMFLYFSATFSCLLFQPPFFVKHLPFVSLSASFFCSSCSPTFLKASPKLVAAQKAQNVLLQKPQRVAPFSSAPLFCSSPFSFQIFFLANF